MYFKLYLSHDFPILCMTILKIYEKTSLFLKRFPLSQGTIGVVKEKTIKVGSNVLKY